MARTKEYDVSVTRTRHYDEVFRVKAKSAREAVDLGLEQAMASDANTWEATWEDPVVDGVHPVKQQNESKEMKG